MISVTQVTNTVVAVLESPSRPAFCIFVSPICHTTKRGSMRLRWRTGATPHGDNGNGNGQMDLATLPGTPPESRDLMSKTCISPTPGKGNWVQGPGYVQYCIDKCSQHQPTSKTFLRQSKCQSKCHPKNPSIHRHRCPFSPCCPWCPCGSIEGALETVTTVTSIFAFNLHALTTRPNSGAQTADDMSHIFPQPTKSQVNG